MTQGERPLVSWPSRVKVKSILPASTPPGTPQSARYLLQSSFEIDLILVSLVTKVRRMQSSDLMASNQC
jgi:hypothetical protein